MTSKPWFKIHDVRKGPTGPEQSDHYMVLKSTRDHPHPMWRLSLHPCQDELDAYQKEVDWFKALGFEQRFDD